MTRIRALAVILLIAVLGYGGLWFTAAFKLERDAKAALNGASEALYSAESRSVDVGGFPYRLEVTVRGLTLTSKAAGAVITADRAFAVSHLWTPGHWVIDAEGIDLTFADHGLSIDADNALISVKRRRDRGTTVAVDLAPPNAPAPSLGLNGDRTDMDQAFVSVRFGESGPTDTSALYEGTLFDLFINVGAGGTSFEGRASVTGPKTLAAGDTPILKAWRDEGGLMTIETLTYRTEDGALEGSGSLSLDERMRPLATFAGVVTAGNRSALELLAPLGLTVPDDDMSAGDRLDLMIQNGLVLVGGQSVGRVGSLN